MKRRHFLGLGALMPAALFARGAQAQRAGSNSVVPASIPIRPSGPVEVAYKAPHGMPNGLTAGPNPGELWVQDRGIGLTGDQITRIFEPFTQVAASERSRGGIGIGLTLARQIVEMHGGTIHASSAA